MAKLMITETNGINLVTEDQLVKSCHECHDFLNRFDQELLSPKKPGVNFSQSADGYYMASKRLKTFLDEFSSNEITYRELPSGYHAFWPTRSAFVDLSYLSPKIGKTCKTCGRLKSLNFAEHPNKLTMIAGETRLDEWGIIRSEQEFGGEGNGHFFLIFVGDMLARKLKEERMTGINLFDLDREA